MTFDAAIRLTSLSLVMLLGGAGVSVAQKPGSEPDFVKATPMSLPIAPKYGSELGETVIARALAKGRDSAFRPFPGFSPGATGDGVKSMAELGAPGSGAPTESDVRLLDFGTAGLPFSTARADLDPTSTNDQYPYRAAGKLFFLVGGESFICSASLIKRGLVVTAAHCVAKYGTNQVFSGWVFVPGYREGLAPYGKWTVAKVFVAPGYLDGSSACSQSGVVCVDDIAILALEPVTSANGRPRYAGDGTGWFSYGWDLAGFTQKNTTHVTQIGYPNCLDGGVLMQRNDSGGAIDAEFSNNTVIGSLMCGGSSGGPWLVNFGLQPQLTGTRFGGSPAPNQVVGVTSWGSTDKAVKWMGASPFLSSNIVELVNAACKAFPDACK